jgi:hypothetical protein
VTSPEPEQFAEVQVQVDLVTVLLDKAVHAGYALDELQALASRDPHNDPRASAQVAAAIANMTRARTALLHAADILTQMRRSPST